MLSTKEKIEKLESARKMLSDEIDSLYKELEKESAVKYNEKYKNKFIKVVNDDNDITTIYYITNVQFEGRGFIRVNYVSMEFTVDDDYIRLSYDDASDPDCQGENIYLRDIVEITPEEVKKIVEQAKSTTKNCITKFETLLKD